MDLDTIREVVVARERADLDVLSPNSAILAGGTWLFSEPQDRLERLVDITTLGWPALTVTAAGLEIAATCTLAELDAAAGPEPATAVAGPPAVEFPEPAAARSATSSNGTATPAESRNGTPKPVPSPPAPAASMAARFGNSIEAEPNSAGFSEHGDPAATFAGAGAHSGVPAGAVRSAGSSETDGTRTGTPMPAAWTAAALFPQACRALLASYKIRRAATVGGNVCLGLPAGAVLAALVALDGTAVVWQPDGGDRSIPLAHFVTGPGTTVLLPGEVLRSIRIEAAKLCSRTAFRKIALAPLGRSGAVVMGRRDADGRCVITLSAATVRPVVLEFGAVPADGELVATILDLDRGLWFDDPHGTPAWRRHVSTVLAGEVLAELRGELP